MGIPMIDNINIYAMRILQKEMEGEWDKAGIRSEADIVALCREARANYNEFSDTRNNS